MAPLSASSNVNVEPSSSVSLDDNGPPLSPLASTIDALVAAGYHPIPAMAAEKIPAEWVGSIESGHWSPMGGWNRFSKMSPPPAMVERWKTWPDANIGIVLGTIHDGRQLICADIDTDDAAEQEAIIEQLPPFTFAKKGNRGFSIFLLAPLSVHTKTYRVPAPTPDKPNGTRTTLEILTGNSPRQTIMPPSLHPLGMTYSYLTGDHVVPIERLPVLTEAHFLALDDVMERLGWNRAAASTAADRPAREAGDGETTIWRETNDYALRSLDFWVPDLRLPKTRRRGAGAWEAVANWRSSGTGRDESLRRPNLKFHTRGIKDMGTEVGYTPLDVVEQAFGCTFDDAFAWLRTKLGLGQDADTLVAPAAALTRDADGTLHDAVTGEVVDDRIGGGPGHDDAPGEAEPTEQPIPPPPPAPSIFTWDDRIENEKDEHDWLIREILSRRGVSMIWGQSGVGKGFATLEIAACVMLGEPFFEQKVKAHGGVLVAFGEGKGSMAQRMNALREGRFGPNPINPATGEPMDRDRLPIMWFPVSGLSNEATSKVFAANIREAKRLMMERHGRTLRLVILDTLNASFGFALDPGSAEGTNAMKKLGDLGTELDLLFLVVHHAGKVKEAGETGTHAWRASVEESINVYGDKHVVNGTWSNRKIILIKARDGTKEGWAQPFKLKSIPLGFNAENEPRSSSIIVANGPAEQSFGSVDDRDEAVAAAGGQPAGINRILAALTSTLTASDDGHGRVPLSALRATYAIAHPGGDTRRNFNRDLQSAKGAGIVSHMSIDGFELVWATAANDNSEHDSTSSHAYGA